MKMNKAILFIVAWCASLSVGLHAAAIELGPDQQAALLDEARAAFSAGAKQQADDPAAAKAAFGKAADKYMMLSSAAEPGADLLMSLGNAQLLAGREAQALASYTRAQRLSPGDRDIARHVTHARELLGVEAQAPAGLIAGITSGDVLPFQATKWIALIAWNVVWLAVVGAVFHAGRRKAWLWLGAPAAVLCLAAGSVWASASWRFDQRAQVIVLQDDITPRQGDGKAFDAVPGYELNTGDQARVLDRRGDWIKVMLSERSTGWLPADAAALIEG